MDLPLNWIAHSRFAEVYEITSETGKLQYETIEGKESKNSVYGLAGKCIPSTSKVRYPKSGDFDAWV